MLSRALRLAVILLALLALPAGATPTQPPSGMTTMPAAPPPLIPWQTDLTRGQAEAQKSGAPILVIIEAEWCGWCRKLDGEIGSAEVQAKLAGWTRVKLNVDRDRESAQTLAVGPIPALRILNPGGRVVASKDGYMPAGELIAWLEANLARAKSIPEADLVAAGEPNAESLEKLFQTLANADASLREGAIRRLLPYPKLAAGRAAESLGSGPLASRLSILELLGAWRAPIEGLDPWRPETVTAERLAALRQWAASAGLHPTTSPAQLTGEALDAARVELGRYLRAGAAAEAQASRERLARLGTALMPEVYAQLKSANSDIARQRLTSLRYRLVASDALAINWSGGFDRLAAADAQTRHGALDELTKRASALDQDLFLELFSDPEPFMRESSLRTLQSLGGASGTAALVKLLNDPEPNVRAAVLKQLAETPSPQMTGKIVEYVGHEQDTDLVVHAVRVLRGAKDAASTACLMKLLEHESWRVRAEAVEALQETFGRGSSGSADRAADFYAAMIKLLDDSDGFVVSRAVIALQDAQLKAAIKPMAQAIEKRPDIAPEVVKSMTYRTEMAQAAIPYLRKFCASPQAGVRAAGIAGLVAATKAGIDKEILAALADQAPEVRIAGARGLVEIFESYRPQRRRTSVSYDFAPPPPAPGLLRRLLGGRAATAPAPATEPVAATEPAAPADPIAVWLEDFRSGKNREAWIAQAVPLLAKMLAAPTAEERLASAVGLIATGNEDQALPILLAEARKQPAQIELVARALPWLPTAKRLDCFAQAVALKPAMENYQKLASAMAVIPDVAATATLWDQLTPGVDVHAAEAVLTALRYAYMGERYYGTYEGTDAQRKAIAKALRAQAAGGSEMRQLVAMVLLMGVSLDDAGGVARQVLDNAASPELLKLDALTVLLLSQSKSDADKTAIAALVGTQPALRKVAVPYLATGSEHLRYLREVFYLYYSNPIIDDRVYSGNAPALPEAPAGLKPEMIRPLLSDANADLAAQAGYLLALLRDRPGFDLLVKRWRESGGDSQTWRRLVFRAAAVMNDDELTPILGEIYQTFDKSDYNLREFYWTIRVIQGPKALELRKKIRTEVGMSRLQ